MIFTLGLLACIILIALSLLHFHWAIGGTCGFKNSLPTDLNGNRVLNPKKIDSAIVGIGLLMFALIFLVKSGVLVIQLPMFVMNYALWLIIVIFFLRAMGDFKFVGFFKKIKMTEFAKMDTKFYAPLCFLLSLMGLIVELKG
jgi:hypothetical protein